MKKKTGLKRLHIFFCHLHSRILFSRGATVLFCSLVLFVMFVAVVKVWVQKSLSSTNQMVLFFAL